MIVYDKFWQSIKARGISQYALLNKYGFTNYQLNRLKHNKSITVYTLDFICSSLNLTISEVLEYVPDEYLSIGNKKQ